MRIADVEILPVSVPFVEPFEIAGGRATHGRHVVVRLVSGSGEVGYGESAPMSSYSPQTQESVCSEMGRFRKEILGRDPFELEGILLGMAGMDSFAKTGIDTALHDLIARHLGIPIHRLLGGALCQGVDLSWAIGFKPPEGIAREARAFSKMGFRTIKVKVGEEPDLDCERVAAARGAIGPDVKLKVDANQGYDLRTAEKVAGRFEELGVGVFEQPLPRDRWEDLATLHRRIRIPIMADESLRGPDDALRIAREESADILNIKIMKPGGIRPSAKLAILAEALGLPCMLGSMPELGIGTLAGLQLVVTSRVFRYGAELIGPWMFEDDLLESSPALEGGRLMLPDGPGLGLEVDEGKLEEYSV